MALVIKIAATITIILLCSYLANRIPSLAGLIVVTPITGLIVLLWMGVEANGQQQIIEYSRGALLGILPTVLFYLAIFFCLSKNLPFSYTVLISSGLWLFGAVLHQVVLR
ncbi:hypothetical protein QA601_13660 [Chitinispirillales bacterium ANBcel5]|uniref:DUF3147 family protein n=1 Tax=Cellulosispirillum alkaliphilum TaxID=3039283 RepID=UPI002A4F8A6F|nr:hypothetical protein [Chitinispirillales bacterium ANBcel5]